MRERPDLQRTLIVAVSGYGQDEHQARSRLAGVDHHLVKPIDPVAVMAILGGKTKTHENIKQGLAGKQEPTSTLTGVSRNSTP